MANRLSIRRAEAYKRTAEGVFEFTRLNRGGFLSATKFIGSDGKEHKSVELVRVCCNTMADIRYINRKNKRKRPFK